MKLIQLFFVHLLAFDVCFWEIVSLSRRYCPCSLTLSRFISFHCSRSLSICVCALITFYKLLPKRQTNPLAWQRARTRQSSRNAPKDVKKELNRASNKMTKREKKENFIVGNFWKGMKCFKLNGRDENERFGSRCRLRRWWHNKTTFSLWNLKSILLGNIFKGDER